MTVNAILGSPAFGLGVKYNEIGFVDEQTSLGGPLGFFFGDFEAWQNLASIAMLIYSTLLLVLPLILISRSMLMASTCAVLMVSKFILPFVSQS